MYVARAYLAYLGYGAMRLFQDEILQGHGNFWSRKKNLPVPYTLATSVRSVRSLTRFHFLTLG